MDNVGKNIADARKALGITQEELASRVGYKTKSAINKIELGIRDLPQKKISVFAEALGVTPGYLMGWEDEKPTENDGLTANKQALMAFAQSLSEEQAALALRVLKSIVEDEK